MFSDDSHRSFLPYFVDSSTSTFNFILNTNPLPNLEPKGWRASRDTLSMKPSDMLKSGKPIPNVSDGKLSWRSSLTSHRLLIDPITVPDTMMWGLMTVLRMARRTMGLRPLLRKAALPKGKGTDQPEQCTAPCHRTRQLISIRHTPHGVSARRAHPVHHTFRTRMFRPTIGTTSKPQRCN